MRESLVGIAADMEQRAFDSFCNKLRDALRKEHRHPHDSKCCLRDPKVLKIVWKFANLYAAHYQSGTTTPRWCYIGRVDAKPRRRRTTRQLLKTTGVGPHDVS